MPFDWPSSIPPATNATVRTCEGAGHCCTSTVFRTVPWCSFTCAPRLLSMMLCTKISKVLFRPDPTRFTMHSMAAAVLGCALAPRTCTPSQTQFEPEVTTAVWQSTAVRFLAHDRSTKPFIDPCAKPYLQLRAVLSLIQLPTAALLISMP